MSSGTQDGASDGTLTQSTLLRALQGAEIDAGFFDRLKLRYRPFTCPYLDLVTQIEPGSSVFDLGCGSGMLLMLIAEFLSPVRLGGVEVDEGLIANARKLLSPYPVPCDLHVYDGTNVPARVGDYDTVLLIDVLHHVPRSDQEAFLRKVADRLGDGAKLILKDIAGESPLVVFNKAHDLIFSHEIGSERRSEDVRAFLRGCGLTEHEFTRKRMFVYPHYTTVLVKDGLIGKSRATI